MIDRKGSEPSSVSSTAARTVRLEAGPLVDLATAIWRTRNKLSEDDSAYRHAQAAEDALAKAGVRIQSHLGAPYDPGLAIRVLAFQPTPGLDREQIIETIRPTVYIHDALLGMGEVIVGTPIDDTTGTEDSGTEDSGEGERGTDDD